PPHPTLIPRLLIPRRRIRRLSRPHEPMPRAVIRHRLIFLSRRLHRFDRPRHSRSDPRVVPRIKSIDRRVDLRHRILIGPRPVKTKPPQKHPPGPRKSKTPPPRPSKTPPHTISRLPPESSSRNPPPHSDPPSPDPAAICSPPPSSCLPQTTSSVRHSVPCQTT